MRVVIADDHSIVREGLRLMLEREAGIDLVAEAADGRELLQVLGGVSADVILLDIRMPGLNGLDALERVRSVAPAARVLILSMHDEPGYVRRAIELGAAGYILKSADRAELVRALESVHRGEPYLHGELTGSLLHSIGMGEPGRRDLLTARERDVLRLVAHGFENKQIARELTISESTVKTHLKRVFAALDVTSRAEAVAVGARLGLID